MTPQDWFPIVLAIIASIPGLLSLRAQNRKDTQAAVLDTKKLEIEDRNASIANANEVTEKALGMLNSVVTPLTARISSLEELVATQSAQIEILNEGIQMLTHQLVTTGQVPNWKPSEPVTQRLKRSTK